MKPATFRPNRKTKAKTKDTIARWISFLALVALFAMATLPLTSGQHEVTARNATHGSETWHG